VKARVTVTDVPPIGLRVRGRALGVPEYIAGRKSKAIGDKVAHRSALCPYQERK
jgi:hypothetical protein